MFVTLLVTTGLLSGASTDWQEAYRDQDVTVWTRAVRGARAREVRAEALIPAPIERVWQVVTDVEHYAAFMPYVEHGELLASAALRPRHVYIRLRPPLIEPRDYTLAIDGEKDVEKGHFVLRWSIAKDHGPAPQPGIVRLALCDGGWDLQAQNGATRVIYSLLTDPGGALPAWIVNLSNRQSLPGMMAAVRQRSLNPAWHK